MGQSGAETKYGVPPVRGQCEDNDHQSEATTRPGSTWMDNSPVCPSYGWSCAKVLDKHAIYATAATSSDEYLAG